MTTSERFASFADAAAAAGAGPYDEWARGVAADERLVALIDEARPSQRQPVLVFATARILGSGLGSFEAFRAWALDHRSELLSELDGRLTQTNDVRRAGPVALALARIPEPVALLEVGASAGLGLFPDRFALRYRGSAVDSSDVVVLGDPASPVAVDTVVDAADDGERRMPVDRSSALPPVGWRAGLDLAPLDVGDEADLHWLETLLWPGQADRAALLRAAASIARAEPPPIRAGDAVDGLAALVATAPPDLTPVVISTGSLVYLPGSRRQAFVDEVARLGVRWVSYEKSGSLSCVQATLPAVARGRPDFATLALDGEALATGDAHGTRLRVV